MYIALVNHTQTPDEANTVTLLGFLGESATRPNSARGVDVEIHNEPRVSKHLTEEEPLSAPSRPASGTFLDLA